MKPLELARARVVVRFLVGSFLGCPRRSNRRCAISYRVSAESMCRVIYFVRVVSALLGKDRKPGIFRRRLFCSRLLRRRCSSRYWFLLGIVISCPCIVGVAFFIGWRYFSSGFTPANLWGCGGAWFILRVQAN